MLASFIIQNIKIISTIYMSKYYQAGNIDSQQSQQEQNVQKVNQNDKKKFKVDDDDSYYQQDKGKMQTEKEKKNALFKKLYNATISAVNIKDFDKAWDNLQEFIKEIQKSQIYIQKNGFPNIFLKTLKIINEEVNSITSEQKKKLKNSKGLNAMKQKLKNKIMPTYQQKLDNYKQEQQQLENSSDSPAPSEQNNEDQSAEEEQMYKKYLQSDDPAQRRKYWLKREKRIESESEKSEDSREERKKKAQNPGKEKAIKVAQKVIKKDLVIQSAKQAEEQVAKIWKQFAKLSTSSKMDDFIDALEKLNQIQKQINNYEDYRQLSFLLVAVPIRILAISKLTKLQRQPHFPRERWNQILLNVQKIFHKLQNSEDQDLMDKIVTYEQGNDNATLGVNQKIIYRQIISFINNLQRQLRKAFFYLESSEPQYAERLQDLVKFIQLLYLLSKKMLFNDQLQKQAAQISFKVLEKMHFMSKNFMDRISKSSSDLTFTQLSNEETLDQYVKPILKLNDQGTTTKALLYLIYNHALNRRDKAKDLLIITDISQTISARDYFTQVCFNRVLVQLGISAFHQGNLYQTQQILSSVCSMGKSREENKQKIRRLLGQNKSTDKDGGKNRILPYYLHLNIDLIEAVQLIASMVLQVPFTLIEGGKITSKSFKKVAYQYERAHFIAQPLNYRDLVYAASNQLKLGNMKECMEKLSQIDIWNQMGDIDQALQNLKVNIKQTALKCYILANRGCFKCLSLQGLAKKFDMELKAVKKIIYREINDRKIIGTITSDGYLNLTQKRKQKQSGLRSINYLVFSKLEELNKLNEQIFKQRQQAAPEQQQQFDKQTKVARRMYDAFTQKLKNIISRRG